MRDVVIGILAVAFGALFCFRGYLTMRVVLPIWGAFVGFSVGAGLVAAFTDDGFLAGVLAWVVGIAVGLLFGFLAYAYFAASVVIGMASVGFLIGASVMVALDVEWSWVVVLVGVLVGAAFAVLALLGNLPMILLTFLTATSGATAMVAGLMFIFGAIDTADLEQRSVVDHVDDSVWWWLLWLGLTFVGIVVQMRALDSAHRDLRQMWAGGRARRPRTA